MMLLGTSNLLAIDPFNIDINDRKFLVIKFPAEIKYADMGSDDLFAEKSLPNILKIKAIIPYFEKTNLSVVTTDGKYYSFVVNYNSNPNALAIDMSKVTSSIHKDNIINYTNIQVSDLHTSHIILPNAIEDISIGFDNIISEQAQDIDNIVKVKSIVGENEDFFQTSITIITKDAQIYPLLVDYKKNPDNLSISFGKKDNNALFSGVNVNDIQMKKIAEWIVDNGRKINDVGMEEYKMIFQLNSVYTDQDIIAFYLSAQNSSKLDYTLDFVKTYITDKKRAKKTAMQEEEIYPIYVYYEPENKIIPGKGQINMVLFYKKFTIPEKRVLFFELFEHNGGRQIRFTASNKIIIKADIIDNEFLNTLK